jgi:hypothetical protein
MWNTALAKLTQDERVLVESLVATSQVLNSALYMLFAAALGVVGGWCLAGLMA